MQLESSAVGWVMAANSMKATHGAGVYSISYEDVFKARIRCFPPLLLSTNLPDRPLADPQFATQLPSLANRAKAAELQNQHSFWDLTENGIKRYFPCRQYDYGLRA